jgi:hypothetical protein
MEFRLLQHFLGVVGGHCWGACAVRPLDGSSLQVTTSQFKVVPTALSQFRTLCAVAEDIAQRQLILYSVWRTWACKPRLTRFGRVPPGFPDVWNDLTVLRSMATVFHLNILMVYRNKCAIGW